MKYDMRLVSGKLIRWNHYLNSFTLPQWKYLPDLGLYMDQVVDYILRSLDIFMISSDTEPVVTSSAINNYVRLKAMPAPVKKKYERRHLAYLLIICMLKQSLSIAHIQEIVPADLSQEDLEDLYTRFVVLYEKTAHHFASQIALTTGLSEVQEKPAGLKAVTATPDTLPSIPLSKLSKTADDSVRELIISTAITAGFSQLLSVKLIELQGQSFTQEAVADKSLS